MPTISRFFGISILMYYNDHAYPHFHARYGEHYASVDIRTGLITGYFPPSASTLVRQWLGVRRAALLENWRLAGAGLPLRPIEPLE
jgi:Domain of unknown function (DUF4160)